jgi:glycine/D-amino acid oxidase-like deaminating enzyme
VKPIVVIGGGIAGLSVTWALAKRGRKVLLLEKEPQLGTHSSGVNAGIFRVSVGERINVLLAKRSLELGRVLLGDGFLTPIGGLYPCESAATRAAILDAASDAGVVEAAPSALPPWVNPPGRPTLWSPEDGIIDVPATLAALEGESRKLGAEIRTSAKVSRLMSAGGRISGVELANEAIEASTVIDCMGAWSTSAPGAPGLTSVVPHRRHIFIIDSVPTVDVKHVVWDLTDGVYVRPCPEGLLACPCDETPQSADAMHEVDASAPALLRAKLERWAPALSSSRVVRWWSGLRPITPDHRFVVGTDPSLPGLFRLTGFGGHGITAGLAAGDLAAALLDGDEVPEARELSPARFASSSAAH